MAKERLLVCDALDERDFLRKKISSAIREAQFISAKKVRDSKVGGVDVESLKSNISSTYQSIKDQIKRYNAIDVAITQSNATEIIKTRSGVEMTRAAAISQRKVLLDKGNNDTDFIGDLLRCMTQQLNSSVMRVNEFNSSADKQAEALRLGMAGKDTNKKLSDEDIKAIETMVAPLYGELIDPLNIRTEVEKLSTEHNNLVKEIETAIKVSNATTYIEFEY